MTVRDTLEGIQARTGNYTKPIPKPKRKLPSAEGVPPPLPQRRAANPEREERGTLSEPDNANERPAETRVQRNLYNRFPE